MESVFAPVESGDIVACHKVFCVDWRCLRHGSRSSLRFTQRAKRVHHSSVTVRFFASNSRFGIHVMTIHVTTIITLKVMLVMLKAFEVATV